jgi:hypothetical protein
VRVPDGIGLNHIREPELGRRLSHLTAIARSLGFRLGRRARRLRVHHVDSMHVAQDVRTGLTLEDVARLYAILSIWVAGLACVGFSS